jgi:EpsG family
MLIYITYFLLIAILAIQYEFTPFKNNYLLSVVTILLILLAGFRDISVSRDYINYQYIFNSVYYLTAPDSGGNNFSYFIAFEPGFLAIIFLFRSIFELNYGFAIMLFYALTSLSMKAYAINRLSINPYLALLFYFSYFFLIQEMTQIRIGLASAIVLVSFISLLNGKRMAFAGLVLLATCFHYSAIFYLIILLFDIKKLDRNVYIIILVLSVILGFLRLPLLNLLGSFDPSDVSTKLNSYVELSENGSVTINVFNSLNICNILCCFYLLFAVSEEVFASDKKLILFLKCNILSIFLLSFLSGAPAFALRFSQLFSIAQIFLFPYLAKYLPAKKLNVFILVLVAGIFFYVTQFYGDLLHPYKIINLK